MGWERPIGSIPFQDFFPTPHWWPLLHRIKHFVLPQLETLPPQCDSLRWIWGGFWTLRDYQSHHVCGAPPAPLWVQNTHARGGQTPHVPYHRIDTCLRGTLEVDNSGIWGNCGLWGPVWPCLVYLGLVKWLAQPTAPGQREPHVYKFCKEIKCSTWMKPLFATEVDRAAEVYVFSVAQVVRVHGRQPLVPKQMCFLKYFCDCYLYWESWCRFS